MSKNNKENIELSLPVNAAYVSAARLTASSVANRLGFNIEEIEDIKAAVSEACTYIIKKSFANKVNTFKIIFMMQEGALEIHISSEIKLMETESDEEMSLLMVKALMDKLEITTTDDSQIQIIMSKEHKNAEFLEASYVQANSLL